MDLVDKQVAHEVFGEGKVVKCDDSYVKVSFLSGHREFVFPDAFGKYLTLVDPKARSFVGRLVQRKTKELKERQEKLEELRNLREARRRRRVELERRKGRKIHPQSQSVFWCEKEEHDSIFEEWSVSTGVIGSGPRAGEPRRLSRVGLNTACLLTARDRDEPEKKRRILGAFMIGGAMSNDGRICAHPEYRLRLSNQESQKMLFWNYYVNTRYPHKMTWNTGRHRYFDNIWMAQILQGIVSMKEGPQEQELAQRFLRYFCSMNDIEEDEIPKPEGPLVKA